VGHYRESGLALREAALDDPDAVREAIEQWLDIVGEREAFDLVRRARFAIDTAARDRVLVVSATVADRRRWRRSPHARLALHSAAAALLRGAERATVEVRIERR
jgi:hypothetical protein